MNNDTTGRRVRRSLAATWLLTAICCFAPAAPAQIPADTPDVQVVIMPDPSGLWAVSAVYPKVVPKAVAEAHRKRLLELTRWKAQDVEFETRGIRKNNGVRRDRPGPTDPPMSSMTFLTPSHVVDWKSETLPVEPFARAFRDLNRVYVMFMVPGPFKFRGLRQHSDENLDVTLNARPSTFFYAINIKNHKLEALNLPRYQADPPEGDVQAAQGDERPGAERGGLRLVGTGLVVLLALGAGLLAYTWTQRLSGR